jgi:PTS hybrid protein
MTVGLVIVSHSAKIAEGVVELATQMAGGVVLVAAGGTDDGGIGTSFDRVMAAVGEADDGDGVIVLCDLGSAILTTETALDFLDDDLRERVRVANAPIVEGAVAAAVAAEIGGDLDTVLGAAELAAGPAPAGAPGPATSDAATQEVSAEPAPDTVAAEAKLINPSGLHARPAAEFVRLASTFDATIKVNGVDAKSLLSIMALGLGVGKVVRVEASGAQAQQAVDALAELLGSGFGE